MQFMILSRAMATVAICFAFAGAASNAFAQQNSLFGSSGPMSGSSGTGTATTGSTMGSMATSSFPTTAFGAASGAGATGAGMGAGGLGGQPGGQQGMGAAGQQTGQVGQRATRFVGNAQAAQNPAGQNNQMNNRQGQNRNNANRRPGQNANQMGQAGGGAGNQQQRTVRPQMVVAFDHPRPTVEMAQVTLTNRFEKLASKTQFKGINIETDGNQVILRGEVDSARTSRLATILARMEPGVKKVQNELTVKKPSPSPSTTE